MEKHGYADPTALSVEMVSEVQREEMKGYIRKVMYHINNTVEHGRTDVERNLEKAMVELLIANI